MFESYQIKRLNLMKEILHLVGDNFIFKGGTALRFYYGLDGYSEDLDFDAISNNMDIIKRLKSHKDFKNWQIYTKKISETSNRFTIDYGAKTPLGNYPLKIDISGRNKMLLRDKQLAYSKIDGVCVYNIEIIAQMKRQAFLSRNKIRDFYDIGFLLEKYPQCFDKQNLIDIADKIHYSGASALNMLLIDEVKTHKLMLEKENIECICNYAEKILKNIDKLYKNLQKSAMLTHKPKLRKNHTNDNSEIGL